MKVPSHYVIATFQLYGSLMLESPDYFFRVREIGRLRQTNIRAAIFPRKARMRFTVYEHAAAATPISSLCVVGVDSLVPRPSLRSLVTSRPTHKGKGRLVNIERFLGHRPRAAALMGRLVTRLYPLSNYNAHVRETGCTWLYNWQCCTLIGDPVFTPQKVLGPRNRSMFTRRPFPLWGGAAGHETTLSAHNFYV